MDSAQHKSFVLYQALSQILQNQPHDLLPSPLTEVSTVTFNFNTNPVTLTARNVFIKCLTSSLVDLSCLWFGVPGLEAVY